LSKSPKAQVIIISRDGNLSQTAQGSFVVKLVAVLEETIAITILLYRFATLTATLARGLQGEVTAPAFVQWSGVGCLLGW
jgi:hypothetical protein